MIDTVLDDVADEVDRLQAKLNDAEKVIAAAREAVSGVVYGSIGHGRLCAALDDYDKESSADSQPATGTSDDGD